MKTATISCWFGEHAVIPTVPEGLTDEYIFYTNNKNMEVYIQNQGWEYRYMPYSANNVLRVSLLQIPLPDYDFVLYIDHEMVPYIERYKIDLIRKKAAILTPYAYTQMGSTVFSDDTNNVKSNEGKVVMVYPRIILHNMHAKDRKEFCSKVYFEALTYGILLAWTNHAQEYPGLIDMLTLIQENDLKIYPSLKGRQDVDTTTDNQVHTNS